MTSDDIVKMIMAGTGAAATIYTISHQPQPTSLLGRTIGADAGTLTYPYSQPSIGPIVVLGALALAALVLLK
jgi:hypothetical protein